MPTRIAAEPQPSPTDSHAITPTAMPSDQIVLPSTYSEGPSDKGAGHGSANAVKRCAEVFADASTDHQRSAHNAKQRVVVALAECERVRDHGRERYLGAVA